jgi:hypothetical protein
MEIDYSGFISCYVEKLISHDPEFFYKDTIKKIVQLVKKLNERDFKLKSLVLSWCGEKK